MASDFLYAPIVTCVISHGSMEATINFLNIRTPIEFVVITLKVEQDGVSLRIIHPKDAEGIAKSVDPDQTAPLGAV